jgi:hypothetical protein
MTRKIQWASAIAADARVTATASRVAVAVAGLSDERGRFAGRAIDLSAASQSASRHLRSHIEALARLQYLRVISAPKNGKLVVSIMLPVPDEIESSTTKPFIEISGEVIATTIPKVPRGESKSIHLFVEGPAEMVKLTIGREDVEKIVSVIMPPAG